VYIVIETKYSFIIIHLRLFRALQSTVFRLSTQLPAPDQSSTHQLIVSRVVVAVTGTQRRFLHPTSPVRRHYTSADRLSRGSGSYRLTAALPEQ